MKRIHAQSLELAFKRHWKKCWLKPHSMGHNLTPGTSSVLLVDTGSCGYSLSPDVFRRSLWVYTVDLQCVCVCVQDKHIGNSTTVVFTQKTQYQQALCVKYWKENIKAKQYSILYYYLQLQREHQRRWKTHRVWYEHTQYTVSGNGKARSWRLRAHKEKQIIDQRTEQL